MLQSVDVGDKSLEEYREVSGTPLLDEIAALAADLDETRILHLSATPYGGNVSELLHSLIPLERNLGLNVDWKIISGSPEFFAVTKRIHNGLQGARSELNDEDRRLYLDGNQANASALNRPYEIIVVHDPQPAALPRYLDQKNARWIWRCHVDTGTPDPATWDFLRPQLDRYDLAVFTTPEFVPPDLPIARRAIIPPAIDPFSPKNMPIDDQVAGRVLGWIGVSAAAPLVTQVSRFDPWKDPLGVIRAYRLARELVPDLHLALVGSMAHDDPEAWDIHAQIREASQGDSRISVFTNLTGVGNVEVNAFQRLSNVIIQKSIREGFGLVVSEALWKGTAVVAGRAGGIPSQMPEGIGGFLVDDVEDCARYLVQLVQDPDLARSLGKRGHAHVQQHFLLPRLLRDSLRLYRDTMNLHPS